jgi:hypothetical protein
MYEPPVLRLARRSKLDRAVSRTTIAASVFVAALTDTIATRNGSSSATGVVNESIRYPIRLKCTTTVGTIELTADWNAPDESLRARPRVSRPEVIVTLTSRIGAAVRESMTRPRRIEGSL